MQLTRRAVHLALQRGINQALLLHAVQTFERSIHNFRGKMRAIIALHGDHRLRESFPQKIFDILGLNRHCLLLRTFASI